jgi:hypothetical protein
VGDQANAIKARCGLGKDEHGNYEVWPEDSARAMRCLKANTHWNPFWIPGDG